MSMREDIMTTPITLEKPAMLIERLALSAVVTVLCALVTVLCALVAWNGRQLVEQVKAVDVGQDQLIAHVLTMQGANIQMSYRLDKVEELGLVALDNKTRIVVLESRMDSFRPPTSSSATGSRK